MAGPADPLVSVVIASMSGASTLVDCLEALVWQSADVPTEILLVDRCGDAIRSEIRRRFPEVHVIRVERSASLPAMRAHGLAQARGRMIAVLGEHFRVAPTWLAAIACAQREGRPVAGGPIENGSARRISERAFYLCEYARFMPPIPRGPVSTLAGNNCAYDRSLLERLGPHSSGDVWNTVLHDRIRALNVPFYNDPALEVRNEKRLSYGDLLSQRYHCSRSFAALRARGWRWWRRLAFAAATPLLPILVLWRLIATLATKRRGWREFVVASPVLVMVALSWAWGEVVGVLFGPGRSLLRVE